MEQERMLKWFEVDSKPELAAVTGDFHAFAWSLVSLVPQGPERTVALRKLLEAREAAVRAVSNPGG